MKKQNAEVRLLPADLKNEQFHLNLSCFQLFQPELSNTILKHQVSKYQICLNSDDSINILNLTNNTTLYPHSQEQIEQHFDLLNNTLQLHIGMNTAFLGKSDESLQKIKNAPFHPALHKALFQQSHLPHLFDEASAQIKVDRQQINFLPLLRVYGIGLGTHILTILQQFDIASLIINEPEFDLFYSSLYTTPWHQILPVFANDPHKHILFNCEPLSSTLQAEQNFLSTHHPFYYFSKATLSGSLDRDFKSLIEAEKNLDVTRYSQLATGWYDDQATGLKNSLQNINNQAFFYNGKKPAKSFRVFLAGSGPSLNASMAYLKQHQHEALIIACGSAVSSLVKNNIIPDIHVLQERPNDKNFLLHYCDEDTYQQIRCIKLNVVRSEVDELYRETFIIQKSNEPGSTLLPIEHYPHSNYVNPTVTNAGIKICTMIGANEVYMFGIDYGSSENYSKIRADGTYLFKDDSVDRKTFKTIPGNFGKKVYAHEYFAWSVEAAETAISESRDKNIKWINIGDGASIRHTSAVHPQDLPEQLTGNPDRNTIFKQIRQLFDNNYSIDTVIQQIEQVHIPASQDFLVAMFGCFDTIPKSRDAIMTNLSLISSAANVGADEESYLPKKLFGVEIISFLDILYVQVSTTQSDEQAVEIYKNAVPVLQQHIENIYQNFLSIVTQIETPKSLS